VVEKKEGETAITLSKLAKQPKVCAMPGVGKVVGAMNAPKAERAVAVIKNGQ
jgi:hypothetical protein